MVTRADRGLEPFVPGRPVDPPRARGAEVVGDRYVAPLALDADCPPAPTDRRMACAGCGVLVDVPRAGVAYWSRLPVVCSDCGA